MGNSTGMILPKPILTALGLSTGVQMEVSIDNGRVIATPVRQTVREGWEAGAIAVAASAPSSDELDWLAIDDDAGEDWTW